MKALFSNKKEDAIDSNLYLLSDSEWNKVQKRFSIIRPILENKGNKDLIKEVASENNIHVVTILTKNPSIKQSERLPRDV